MFNISETFWSYRILILRKYQKNNLLNDLKRKMVGFSYEKVLNSGLFSNRTLIISSNYLFENIVFLKIPKIEF